jgi:hypothetical protein
MTDEDVKRRVAELRAQGRSPKEIAHVLGVRPAAVAAIVRTIAAGDAGDTAEPAIVASWVSPGWRAGLTVAEHADWPDGEGDGDADPAGLVTALVVREHRYDKVSVCGYLVDVYALGVKDVLGPRAIARRELPGFVERFFESYPAPALEAPVELVRHLVWGAVEYARGLGFEPPAGFEAAGAHLGPLDGSSAITFGRDGRPVFVQGPRDDVASITRTLEAAVGKDGFDVVAGVARESRRGGARPAPSGRGGGASRGSGEAVPGGRQWRSRNR